MDLLGLLGSLPLHTLDQTCQEWPIWKTWCFFHTSISKDKSTNKTNSQKPGRVMSCYIIMYCVNDMTRWDDYHVNLKLAPSPWCTMWVKKCSHEHNSDEKHKYIYIYVCVCIYTPRHPSTTNQAKYIQTLNMSPFSLICNQTQLPKPCCQNW